MTKQEFYEQVVQLTAELSSTGIAKKIYDTAKTSDAKDIEAVFESFKKENSELYQRLEDFGIRLNASMMPLYRIDYYSFGEKKDYLVFDPKEIEAISFYALLIFAKIECGTEIFKEGSTSYCKYIEAIRESGYPELAEFIDKEYYWFLQLLCNEYYPTIYKLLADVFKGKFRSGKI